MHHILDTVVPPIILIIELVAIFVIVSGTVKSIYTFILNVFTDKEDQVIKEMASSMSLALEFILAAEILKTMIVDDRNQLITLSVLLILRIIISFVLHWELQVLNAHSKNHDQD